MSFASIFLSVAILGADLERGQARFTPTALESQVPELFRLAGSAFDYEMELRRDDANYRVHAVRFPSPITTQTPENNTIHAEWFIPKGPGRKPGVIVLHILGADFALSRYMAARLADRGVAALFVKLPYYGERRPQGGDNRLLSVDINRSVEGMRQGVCDVRRAAAWLASRPEIDPERIGVTGISLGGIVSSLAVSVDPAIKQGALLLAGGDLAEVLWTMPEGRRYRDAWIAAGRTKEDLKKLVQPFDPLTYAPGMIGKRVIMMAGNVDDTVPPQCAKALWQAAGKPPIRWFDCGHYSAVAYLLPAIRETVDFFAPTAPQSP